MEWVCFILIMFPFAVVYADDQGNALYNFKSALEDPDNVLQSWDPALSNPCTWYHVTCNSNNNVIRVDLANGVFSGSLVPDLGNLTTLQYLELYNNKINGSIPKELGKLTNLLSLDLYGNSLTGSIPQELVNLKNLQYLRLNDNNLSGAVPFPDQLTNLFPNIQVLDISGNPDLCGAHTNKPCSP